MFNDLKTIYFYFHYEEIWNYYFLKIKYRYHYFLYSVVAVAGDAKKDRPFTGAASIDRLRNTEE